MIEVSEARARIVEACPRLATQWVDLPRSRGRVLAQTIVSPRDFPSHDLSAMDGYALSGVDARTRFEIVGESRAGAPFLGRLEAGQAVRISTGAHVPEGTQTVVMQEICSVDGARVELASEAAPGTHIRTRGSHLEQHEVVYASGTTISSSDVGVLASLNRALVEVFVRPRVVILSTGDELVDLGDQGRPDQIVNSNAWMLASLVEEFGGVPEVWPVVRDLYGDVTRAVRRAAQSADLVLTIGGASVGDHDHTTKAFEKVADGKLEFWKVRMKPGKPLAFGVTQDGTPLIGLPGNPLSAFVCFHQFVRPALSTMQGGQATTRTLEMTTQLEIFSSKGRVEFVPGRLSHADPICFEGPTRLDSGSIAQLRGITALAIVPDEVTRVPAGERLAVQILERTV